ncbi:hypothetical protein [Pseudobacteriovorax antillogorgiicola]|uniref:hypothetical protein n=1 Tax=Pseudobacteriovorax antillogorgiicola TaxID=1513793 RepID=UPI0014045A7C|nr:hypothetical protein [Pseudobacteriovorax antillogorgiicola]
MSSKKRYTIEQVNIRNKVNTDVAVIPIRKLEATGITYMNKQIVASVPPELKSPDSRQIIKPIHKNHRGQVASGLRKLTRPEKQMIPRPTFNIEFVINEGVSIAPRNGTMIARVRDSTRVKINESFALNAVSKGRRSNLKFQYLMNIPSNK